MSQPISNSIGDPRRAQLNVTCGASNLPSPEMRLTLGREFFGNYYEPRCLAEQLRTWWREPELTETTARSERVRVLAEWISSLESGRHGCVGAKHPLLTLCGPDLAEA
jgi:hypothetical protein